MRFSQPVPGGDAYHLCPHFQARTQTQSQITAKEAKRYSLAGCHRGRRKSNKHLSLSILKEFPNIPSQTNNRPKTKKNPTKTEQQDSPESFPSHQVTIQCCFCSGQTQCQPGFLSFSHIPHPVREKSVDATFKIYTELDHFPLLLPLLSQWKILSSLS